MMRMTRALIIVMLVCSGCGDTPLPALGDTLDKGFGRDQRQDAPRDQPIDMNAQDLGPDLASDLASDTRSLDTLSLDTLSLDTLSLDTLSLDTLSRDMPARDTLARDAVARDTLAADTDACGSCAAGLDCVNGFCRCIVGGSCKGCCRSDTVCIAPNQTSHRECGGGGEPCAACNGAEADTCISGSCVCGSLANGKCSANLNCLTGSCQCIVNGRCSGCCDGRVCVEKVTTSKCGAKGSACKACTPNKASHCLTSGATGFCSCHDGFGPARGECGANEVCVPNGAYFQCVAN
jgi:hypothetical protein